jgi:hypothetical protein
LTWYDLVKFKGSKTTGATSKNIKWLNLFFKIIFFFNIKITTYYIDLDQPELTCHIYNIGYETMIIL